MTQARFLRLAAAPLLLAVAGTNSLAAQDGSEPDVAARGAGSVQDEGDAKLARLLEGRVAEEPVRCIRSIPNQRMQTIDGTAYVYGNGRTIFVQRTRDPEQISDDDTLIVNRFGSTQLCRLDQITTIDRVNGFFTGVVFFEDFIPYTRVDAEGGSEG